MKKIWKNIFEVKEKEETVKFKDGEMEVNNAKEYQSTWDRKLDKSLTGIQKFTHEHSFGKKQIKDNIKLAFAFFAIFALLFYVSQVLDIKTIISTKAAIEKFKKQQNLRLRFFSKSIDIKEFRNWLSSNGYEIPKWEFLRYAIKIGTVK